MPVAAAGARPCATCTLPTVEVVVSEHRAADWAHENGPVLQSQVFERLGNQLVDYAMAAARAVVRLVLKIRLALVEIVEDGRLGVNDFVPIAACLRLFHQRSNLAP